MANCLISMGEMMLRLSPPKFERLRSTSTLNVRPCGAQFNIAANLACLGKSTIFISKLPANELGQLAYSYGMSLGVDMSNVIFVENPKIGLVFLEFGAIPRKMIHIYDRQESAASTISPGDFQLEDLLSITKFAYLDGIFPALSHSCLDSTKEYLQIAKQSGCITCFDINYRESLWSANDAVITMQALLPYIDILITNRYVSEKLFGYSGDDQTILEVYQKTFGCNCVCMTYKKMISNEHASWNSVALYNSDIFYGRQYEFQIIDPFGSGDAFFAGLIFGLDEENDIQFALDFGNALCALSHTIEGDQANISKDDVYELLRNEDISLITKR